MDQNGPLQSKWTKLVHFGITNAKLRFGIRSFRPKWLFGPFWTILVQYTFQQYRGHSLPMRYLISKNQKWDRQQGYGNRPPIDDRNPIRKFSIDCLDASKTNEQTQPQVTRHCRESRRKADTEFQVSTAHRRYGHRLRTPFLRTPAPRLLSSGTPRPVFTPMCV